MQGSKPALEAAFWKLTCCREGQTEISAKAEKTKAQSAEKLLLPPTPQKTKHLKVSKLLNTREQTNMLAMSYLLLCRSVGTSCWAESQHSQASCPSPFWSLGQPGGCEGKDWAKGKTCQDSIRSCMALALLKAPCASPHQLDTQGTHISAVRHGSWKPTPPHSTDNKACDFWLSWLWLFPSSVPALLPVCTDSSKLSQASQAARDTVQHTNNYG